jgi:hypothetical protein
MMNGYRLAVRTSVFRSGAVTNGIDWTDAPSALGSSPVVSSSPPVASSPVAWSTNVVFCERMYGFSALGGVGDLVLVVEAGREEADRVARREPREERDDGADGQHPPEAAQRLRVLADVGRGGRDGPPRPVVGRGDRALAARIGRLTARRTEAIVVARCMAAVRTGLH